MKIGKSEDEFGNEEESKNGEETISIERIEPMPIDRLSALPDGILIRILCILDFNANQAAATSVLSKRWQSLWSVMPGLSFFDNSRNPEERRNFVSWVHKTLLQRREFNLEQLRVQLWYDECYAEDVNAWVHFAVKNKVKDLSLVLCTELIFYTPPQVLYSDPFLTQLYLRRCIVAPQSKIEWSWLTILKVQDVALPQEVLENILAGCPVLYGLDLTSCWGFNSVNSESLHDISVLENNVDMLEISAPNLNTLHISCYPLCKRVQLKNELLLLDSAKIQLYGLIHPDEFMEIQPQEFMEIQPRVLMESTMGLLENTDNAQLLVLGGAFVEVLSYFVMWNPFWFPQSRRASLTLETRMHRNSLPATLALLKSSTNLEEFLMECSDWEYTTSGNLDAMNDMDLADDLSDLKTVRLLHIADRKLSGEPTLTVARVLLKRATRLQKMVIKIEGVGSRHSSNLTTMSQMVLGYPRSSENAVIIFHQSTDEHH